MPTAEPFARWAKTISLVFLNLLVVLALTTALLHSLEVIDLGSVITPLVRHISPEPYVRVYSPEELFGIPESTYWRLRTDQYTAALDEWAMSQADPCYWLSVERILSAGSEYQ